jgi:hypothetical protein
VATHRNDSRDPALQCRRRFLRYFPRGFADETYLAWERDYKAAAAREWRTLLGRARFRALLDASQFGEIAAQARRIESHTNLLFSFEKMALRDATRSPSGARAFAEGLYDVLHGDDTAEARFTRWCETVAGLPRKQTRVLTWPIVTVFLFLAQPARHIFLKPNVTRIAAARYGVELRYQPQPHWPTYHDLLRFAARVKRDLDDLAPRDMIDLQSFIWVQGSAEYSGRSFKPALTIRVAAGGSPRSDRRTRRAAAALPPASPEAR